MKLTQTETTRRALGLYLTETGPNKEPSESAQYADEWIDHSLLIQVATRLSNEHPSFALSKLVRGTDVYHEPPPPPPAKTTEYIELMERLRAQRQELEYQALLGPKSEAIGPILNPSEVKEAKEELTTIFNIMVSVVAVAFAVWYWTKNFELTYRTLLCLFAAILTLVAEVVVYFGYKRRVEEARVLERRKKEKKVVKQQFVLGDKPQQTLIESNEKATGREDTTLKSRSKS